MSIHCGEVRIPGQGEWTMHATTDNEGIGCFELCQYGDTALVCRHTAHSLHCLLSRLGIDVPIGDLLCLAQNMTRSQEIALQMVRATNNPSVSGRGSTADLVLTSSSLGCGSV